MDAPSFSQLRAFVAVANEGSFSGAAYSLGYTQSAVSHQIAALERSLGVSLVHRPGGPRPISLTPAGERFCAHAAGIIKRLEMARADMSAVASGRQAQIRVGAFQSAALHIFPHILKRLHQRWPEAEVDLIERPADDELLDLVERGNLDLTFVQLPVDEGAIAWRKLWQGEYVLIVAADSSAANSQVIPTTRDLARLPLIAYRRVRRAHRMEEYLAALGHDPQIVFRTDENATIQRLVGTGFGVAIVPELAVDTSDSQVVAIRGLEGLPPFVLGIGWHEERALSPLGHIFVDTAREIGGTFVSPSLNAAVASRPS